MKNENDGKHFFDRQGNVLRLIRVFFVCCGLLLLGDFFVSREHVHLASERWPFFYAVYGFVACVVLVLVSKYVLRPLVMRDEDYYE